VTGRHVLLLLAAAAVALCALFVLRALDAGDPEPEIEPVEVAPPPTPPVARTEREPEPTPDEAEPTPPIRPATETAPDRTAHGGLEEARAALRHLAGLLRNSRAINEELLAALDEVQGYYLHPPPPPGLVTHTPPQGANANRSVVLEANLRLQAQEQGWSAEYLDEILAWRRKAEGLFLKALKLRRLTRDREVNLREDVNVRAAQVIASTRNAKLSRDVIRTAEKTLLKAKHTVSQTLYDETFAALAQLGHPDALEWLRDEFIHSKSSPASQVDQLSAAHKAMRRFDRDQVPGRARYELVQEMVRTYAGVESAASSNDGSDRAQTMQRLWDRIRVDVIRAVQYFSLDPMTDTGESLVTMAEFVEWFRDHKDPRKHPWKND